MRILMVMLLLGIFASMSTVCRASGDESVPAVAGDDSLFDPNRPFTPEEEHEVKRLLGMLDAAERARREDEDYSPTRECKDVMGADPYTVLRQLVVGFAHPSIISRFEQVLCKYWLEARPEVVELGLIGLLNIGTREAIDVAVAAISDPERLNGKYCGFLEFAFEKPDGWASQHIRDGTLQSWWSEARKSFEGILPFRREMKTKITNILDKSRGENARDRDFQALYIDIRCFPSPRWLIPILTRIALDTEEFHRIREHAIYSLGWIATHHVVPVFITLLEDKDKGIAEMAKESLKWMTYAKFVYFAYTKKRPQFAGRHAELCREMRRFKLMGTGLSPTSPEADWADYAARWRECWRILKDRVILQQYDPIGGPHMGEVVVDEDGW